MVKYFFLLGAWLVVATGAWGQTAPVPGSKEDLPVQENLTSFASWEAEIRKVNGHWELWAGKVKIKDLGNRETDAREVLRWIRLLHLNQRGTVGTPLPAMEYWLADGRAPQKMGRINSVIFDPEALRVANWRGQWSLADETRPWFTFGAHENEARQALQIIGKYQFTDIVYVGAGNPVMIVFLAGQDPKPKAFPSNSSLAGDHKGQEAALWLQPPQLHVNPTLTDPVTGRELVRFDPRQATLRSQNLDWQLIADGQVLAHFGTREADARDALRAVQALRLTERGQVGDATPLFTFFLVDGQPARSLYFGAKTIPCHSDELSLERIGGRWAIMEHERIVLALGSRQEEAQEVLHIMQHYKVDHLCQIGSSEPASVTILIRAH
jgi:hypothetical protein